MIKKIVGNSDFIEYLRGKSATFALSISTTKTCEIDGLTQAGIPGLIHLTPTLDAEFFTTQEVRSLTDIATTPKGVPTPALISRAVHLLNPFREIEIFDLGVEVKPKIDYFKIYEFGLSYTKSIKEGAGIDAKKVFELGFNFATNYELKSDYLILGESVPSGTTTALCSTLALGYDCKGKFSSSYKDSPESIKNQVIKSALKNIENIEDDFFKLSLVSDNMLIFNAGFVVGASKRGIKTILAGGTQMAGVLLIADKLSNLKIDGKNLGLFTTKWLAEDENSDLKALLQMLSFELNAFYSDFDFSLSEHPALKLYDEGEAKEGVGAGACLVYADLNGVDKYKITKKIEVFLQ